MPDQDPYNEQAPMTFQTADDSYQAAAQEAWHDDSYQQAYQQPAGNPCRQPTGNPYPPSQGWPAYPPRPYHPPAAAEYDSGSLGWLVLGALFPLVGFVLFLVWERRKPECAKMAGLGALISALAVIIFAIATMIIAVMLLPSPYSL